MVNNVSHYTRIVALIRSLFLISNFFYFSVEDMEFNVTPQQTLNDDNEKIEKLVINMLQKCKFEAENNKLQIPLEDFEDRVSYYTGIDKFGLEQIYTNDKTASTIYTHSVDLNTHISILNCLFKFYERKELPTFRLLFKNVNELKQTFQDYELYKQKVSSWGFGYHTIFNNTMLLMEDPKITFERYLYLKKIKEARQKGTLIYYINERIIDNDCKFEKVSKQNIERSNTSKNEWIFFHAISRQGFTRGLFCLNATEDDFFKWVVDILLGSLLPSSVIVLDNSPLHGTLKSKSISMYDTKSDMQKWLQNHNVPCSSTMNKSQLYELIEKHPLMDEVHRVDRALRANGHEVLRLPTHFENLSPTQFLWQDIRQSTKSTKEINSEVLSMLTNIMTIENYQFYEKFVEDIENEYFLIDSSMDNVLDNLITDLKANHETIT